MPNLTGGCTRPGVRVAMEFQLLMGALEGPREKASASKGPPEAQNVLKDHKSKKIEKCEESLIKVCLLADPTVK